MWVAAHAPERVERLVLCCTSARLGPPSAWLERAATVRADGVGAIADAVLGRWFTPAFAARPPRGDRAHAGDPALRPRSRGLRRLLRGDRGDGSDARDLPSITAPTLVIAGEQDPATPPEHGRRIADLIPGARFEVISPAAHLATIERPDLTTAMILRFLSRR